jgi:SET domain-containing protein 6
VSAKHSRYDVVEIPWDLVLQSAKGALPLSDTTWTKAISTLDPDEMEESFVLERETGDPDSTGVLEEAAVFESLPHDLEEQVKTLLKAVKKVDSGVFSDKRKRDDLIVSVLRATLESRLAQYMTTISADEGLLASSTVESRQRMAIHVRLGEKRLLEEALVVLSAGKVEDEGLSAKKAKR